MTDWLGKRYNNTMKHFWFLYETKRHSVKLMMFKSLICSISFLILMTNGWSAFTSLEPLKAKVESSDEKDELRKASEIQMRSKLWTALNASSDESLVQLYCLHYSDKLTNWVCLLGPD